MRTHDEDDVDGFLQRFGNLSLQSGDNGVDWVGRLRTARDATWQYSKTALTHPCLTVPAPYVVPVLVFASMPLGILVGAPGWAFPLLSMIGLVSGLVFLLGSYAALDDNEQEVHAVLTALSTVCLIIGAGSLGTAHSNAHFLSNHRSGLTNYATAMATIDDPAPETGGELIKRGALPDRHCPGVIKEKVASEGATGTTDKIICQGPKGEEASLQLSHRGKHTITVEQDDALDRTVLQISDLDYDEAHAISNEYSWVLNSYSSEHRTATFFPE